MPSHKLTMSNSSATAGLPAAAVKTVSSSMAPPSDDCFDDVMDLISQAKDMSASLDKTMKEMKHTFDELSSEEDNAAKEVKCVRFVPLSRTQIEYITSPSALLCQRLYYSDEEYQEQLEQLQADLETWAVDDPPENDFFTSRGLERRTVEGSAQRVEWRTACRDRVLDEQDRQWMELPIDEPVDADEIALISMATTRDAREAAFQQGLLDQRDVYGDQYNHQMRSTATLPTVASLCESSVMGESASCINWNEVESMSMPDSSIPSLDEEEEEEDLRLNSKGHCVHWPRDDASVLQLYFYSHVRTEEEHEAYWYPNWSEEEAKEQVKDEIACLASPKTNPAPRGESLRGLESRTPLAETALQQQRLELFMKVYAPQFKDDTEQLARQCQRVSARAKKEARARAMMDLRAVKEDEEKSKYNKKKKLRTRKSKTAPSRERVSAPRCSRTQRKSSSSSKKASSRTKSKSVQATSQTKEALTWPRRFLTRSESMPSIRDLDAPSTSPLFLQTLLSSTTSTPPKREIVRQSSCRAIMTSLPLNAFEPCDDFTIASDIMSIASGKSSGSISLRLSQSDLCVPEDLYDVDTTDGDSVTFSLPRLKSRRKKSKDVASTPRDMSWDEKDEAPWNRQPFSFDYNRAAAPRRSPPSHDNSSVSSQPRRKSMPSGSTKPESSSKTARRSTKTTSSSKSKAASRTSLPSLLARLDERQQKQEQTEREAFWFKGSAHLRQEESDDASSQCS